MDPLFFLKGLIIGFAMAIPIGPVGVLCIRKTLAEGHARGMFIGLGAATADSMYASMAAFGLTFISDAVTSHQFWVSLGGGSVLFYLGIRTFLSKKKKSMALTSNKGLAKSYASAFFSCIDQSGDHLCFCRRLCCVWIGEKHQYRLGGNHCLRCVCGIISLVPDIELCRNPLQEKDRFRRTGVGQQVCRNTDHRLRCSGVHQFNLTNPVN